MSHRQAAVLGIGMAGLTVGWGGSSTSTAATAATTAALQEARRMPAVSLPDAMFVDSMAWPSADDGWLIAQPDSGAHLLLRTTDGGATWATPDAGDGSEGLQVVFADTNNGWIVGNDGVQSTHDGGATWNAVTLDGAPIFAGAAATAGGTVHVAYLASGSTGVGIASSPIDEDAFVDTGVNLPVGAGPVFDVSMSAGGPYAELIYNDRYFLSAAEIVDGAWAPWDLACPYDYAYAASGLSPGGAALAIACSPSGWSDNAPVPVIGANLASGTLDWATVVPAGEGGAENSQPLVDFATATDDGVRVVGFRYADGRAEIASSSDEGATWQSSATLPAGTRSFGPVAHLPDGSLLVASFPSAGLISPDGITWTPVETTTV